MYASLSTLPSYMRAQRETNFRDDSNTVHGRIFVDAQSVLVCTTAQARRRFNGRHVPSEYHTDRIICNNIQKCMYVYNTPAEAHAAATPDKYR